MITFKYVPLFNYTISRNCQHIFCIYTCHPQVSQNFPTDLFVISIHRCFSWSQKGMWYFLLYGKHPIRLCSLSTVNQNHCHRCPDVKDTYPQSFQVIFSGKEKMEGRVKLPQPKHNATKLYMKFTVKVTHILHLSNM